MSNQQSFSVIKREHVGKGSSRGLRNKGFLPALVYGDKKASTHVYLEKKYFTKHLDDSALFNEMYTLDIQGKKENVLIREIQFNPLRDHDPIHVNFLRVGKNSVVTIEVPIIFNNQAKCVGLKLGGVLNIITHSLELRCNPKDAPKSIEIDLETARIGTVIKIEDIALKKGIKTFYPEGFAIASITATESDSATEDNSEEEPNKA